MSSTRNALQKASANLDESIGVRQLDIEPRLSPVASEKDIGRLPLRTFGKVEVNRIIPDPAQPRTEFDEEELARLAESIRKTGQLHPIRVRWVDSRAKWVIVTGERRWRATQLAGLEHIDCYFHQEDATESELLEEQLIENLLRRQLRPLEQANAYSKLMTLNGWSGKEVAEALNVSASSVTRALALLELPDSIKAKVEAGELPKSAAYEISKLENPTVQETLSTGTAADAISHQATARAVRTRRGRKAQRRDSGLRQSFRAENGINVSVTARRKSSYSEVEEALQQALEEVQHRIANNVQLF